MDSRIFPLIFVFFWGWIQLFGANDKQISITQFGAYPNDSINDAEALQKAAAYCRSHAGITLLFPSGVYNFRHSEAIKIEQEAIGGAYGEDVQGRLFHPKAPYVKALNLTGCEGLTIKAEGVILLLEGWYEVISLAQAKNVTIEGISIQYKRKPSTVGKIIASTDSYFDITFDPQKYYYLDSVITGRIHFFDHLRQRLYTGSCSAKKRVSFNRIRLYSTQKPPLGDYCILRHGGHYRPAVLIKESENIKLKNVKIFSQPGMGVVGHLSKNITLDNLQVVPEPDNVISTNTDATHFTSCSGEIRIQNCKFKGQGDDCTNIHNYYFTIHPISDSKLEIRLENADLHAQALDYPLVGDTMIVINKNNLEEQGKYIVERVDTSFTDWKVTLQLNKPIRIKNIKDYYITNYSRTPKVRILNNTVNSHLARAFLIKSRDVVIANNSIIGSTLTAIQLGAELGWRESMPIENAIIENNYIYGCGYISPQEASAIMLRSETSQKSPYVNRNIIIRNNIFDNEGTIDVWLKNAENVQIMNNLTKTADYVRQSNCKNVIIQ